MPSPGCLIVLIDQSKEMGADWPGEKLSKSAGVIEACRELFADLPDGDYEVAVLAYQTDNAKSPVLHSLLTPGNCSAVPRSRLAAGAPFADCPQPDGLASQKAAFEGCVRVLDDWQARAGNEPVGPLILHFSGSPRPAGDPLAVIKPFVEKWKKTVTPPVVFNVQLCTQAGASPVVFPAGKTGIPLGDYYLTRSSLLGAELAALANSPEMGLKASAQSIAAVLEADAVHVRRVLQLAKSLAERWSRIETRIAWQYPPEATASSSTPVETRVLAGGAEPSQTPLICRIRSAPAVDPQDRIYVNIANELVILDGAGTVLGRSAQGGALIGDPVLGPDGFVRVHGRDGVVACVDAAGVTQWKQVVGPPLSASRLLVDPYGNTLVCVHRGGLVAIGPDGKLREDYVAPPIRFDAPGCLHAAMLYIGGADKCLHALELTPNSARDTWQESGPSRGRTCDVIHAGPVVFTAPKAATVPNVSAAPELSAAPDLIVASRDDCLYSFAVDGTPRWTVDLGGRMLSATNVIWQDRILIPITRPESTTGRTGVLKCLRAANGQPLWECVLSAAVASTPAVDEAGVVYIGDDAGTIHAVAPDGRKLWTKQLSSTPVRSRGVLVAPGRVAFGADDGRLVVMKCGS